MSAAALGLRIVVVVVGKVWFRFVEFGEAGKRVARGSFYQYGIKRS